LLIAPDYHIGTNYEGEIMAPADAWDYEAVGAGGTFSLSEFERNAGRFWKLPVELARDGTLREMLSSANGRSRGIASSILPVLALLAWPDSESDWTKEVFISLRYLARLAGINKDSARRGMETLEALGLLTVRKVTLFGHRRLLVSLETSLYATGDERFAKFPAELIFGGGWSLIGSPAARHLLLVILCRQPVLSEEGLTRWMEQRGKTADNIAKDIASKRRTHALSLGRLSQLSGLARSTVQAGLKTLSNPLPGAAPHSVPILQSGKQVNGKLHLSREGAMRWYALNDKGITANPFFAVDESNKAASTEVSDGENYRTDMLDLHLPMSRTSLTDDPDGLHRYAGRY
jgi:hypothetical protein